MVRELYTLECVILTKQTYVTWLFDVIVQTDHLFVQVRRFTDSSLLFTVKKSVKASTTT